MQRRGWRGVILQQRRYGIRALQHSTDIELPALVHVMWSISPKVAFVM